MKGGASTSWTNKMGKAEKWEHGVIQSFLREDFRPADERDEEKLLAYEQMFADYRASNE